MVAALARIAGILGAPAPTLPELPDSPTQADYLQHYALLARAYASDALLTRQALGVMVREMQSLQVEVKRGRRSRKTG